MLLDGDDVLPELLAEHGDELAASSSCRARLLEELGAIPSYYLHYFYAHDRVLERAARGRPRAEEVAEIERGLLELYRDPTLDAKPALLEQRGGAFYSEAALALVAALEAADGAVEVVDVANGGGARGARAPTTWSRCPRASAPAGRCRSPQPPLAPELLGLVQHVAAYERLAVQAALSRRARRPRARRCSRTRSSASGSRSRSSPGACSPRAPTSAPVRRPERA